MSGNANKLCKFIKCIFDIVNNDENHNNNKYLLYKTVSNYLNEENSKQIRNQENVIRKISSDVENFGPFKSYRSDEYIEADKAIQNLKAIMIKSERSNNFQTSSSTQNKIFSENFISIKLNKIRGDKHIVEFDETIVQEMETNFRNDENVTKSNRLSKFIDEPQVLRKSSILFKDIPKENLRFVHERAMTPQTRKLTSEKITRENSNPNLREKLEKSPVSTQIQQNDISIIKTYPILTDDNSVIKLPSNCKHFLHIFRCN
jgi:hypothetical protein